MVRFLEWSYLFFAEATVEDRDPGTGCLKESEIEDLARGTLSHEIEQRCLAHLLWCESCEQKVNEETEFAHATRTAAAILAQRDTMAAPDVQPVGWYRRTVTGFHDAVLGLFGTHFPARWAGAGLACGALVVLAVVVPLRRTSVDDVVVLRSERGSAIAATAVSAPGADLHLRIDVSDVAPRLLYGVTVVDSVGQTLETSEVKASSGSATVTVHKQLPPGQYWIRLTSPDGQLLREYALRIRS